jgi:hypothetical protein
MFHPRVDSAAASVYPSRLMLATTYYFDSSRMPLVGIGAEVYG